MKHKIVELLVESLLRLDQLVDQPNKTTEEIHGLRTEIDKRFEWMDTILGIAGILERLEVGCK